MGNSLPGSSRPAVFPLAVLAAAFSSGILLESMIPSGPTALIALAAMTGAFSIAFSGTRSRTALLLIAFMFAGAACNASRGRPDDDSVRALLDSGVITEDDPVDLLGEVGFGAEPMPNGAFFDIACEEAVIGGRRQRVSGTVRIFVAARDPVAEAELAGLDIVPGRKLLVSLRLQREDKFRNPGGTHYADVLDRRGLDASATIKSPLLIEVLGPAQGQIVNRLVNRFRKNLIRSAISTFEQPASGVVVASVLGNRYFLTRQAADSYRDGGTFHVLVISGLHVTFVGGLVIWLLSAFSLSRVFRFGCAAAAVWAFAFLSGLGTPVVRAAVMFSVIAIANGIYRRAKGLNSLGLCALAMLFLDPSDLFDPSFQLTIVSAGAIVGAAFPMVEKLRAVGRWYPAPNHPFPPRAPNALIVFCEVLYWSRDEWESRRGGQIWDCVLFKSDLSGKACKIPGRNVVTAAFEGVVVSLIVGLFLLPLLVLYFHRFVPAAPIMNLTAGLFLLIQNSLALIALVLSPASTGAADSFASLSEFTVGASIWLQQAVSLIPGGSIRVPVYTGHAALLYFLYYVPLVFLSGLVFRWDPFAIRVSGGWRLVKRMRMHQVSFVMFAAFAATIIFHPFSEPPPDGRLRVDFLDVGQGDSMLVTFPDGKTMLVDGGGRRRIEGGVPEDREEGIPFEPDQRGIGESVVSEFLWEMGYSKIDRIVVTHSDADHLDGLVDVARNFEIGAAYFGEGYGKGGVFPEFERILRRQSVPLVPVRAGDSFESGEARVEVLNPPGTAAIDGSSDNDGSVVLMITYGMRRFLLTGDIELGAEGAILTRSGDIISDVVKVPHHGSRTSSTSAFVSAVSPDYAVISVGKRSPFGHPHKEVVERWNGSGSKVLTTGDSGMITISTDGALLEVRVFAGESSGN